MTSALAAAEGGGSPGPVEVYLLLFRAQVAPGDCAQPLHRRFGLVASARASFYLYNDRDDVDALVGSLVKAGALFGYVSA